MKNFDKIFAIKNFIDDTEKYSVLKDFWKESIKEVIGTGGEGYVHNFYANGKEILDGNPIYSTLIKNNKGIRIIQLEVDSDEPIFASWIDTIQINGNDIEELVVSLQLNHITFSDTKELIFLFNNNALTPSILLGTNEKYDVKWNLGKLSYAVQNVDYNTVFHDFLSIDESAIDKKEFTLKPFKDFNHYYNEISWHGISFVGESRIFHSYNNFIKSIDAINEMVNVHEVGILNKARSKQQYIVFILDKWGSSHSYITKLHSYTTEAEKEFEFLKENFQSTEF